MERKTQLLDLVNPLSKSGTDALKYAEHLETLLDFIVPERIGEAYTGALENHDFCGALAEYAAFLRKRAPFSASELRAEGSYSRESADNCVKGRAREVNIDWDFGDEVDFLFDPTELKGPRNHEWLWQFNRHGQWIHMAKAYADTKDEKYARTFEKQLLKWIAETDIPANHNGPGSAWRTIECGIRLLGSWQIAFDGFRHSPSVSDAALLLMVSSMHRQTIHLLKNPTRANWLMMESNGVYTFSSLFPEFSDSSENRAIAASRIMEEVRSQILPDGMHNELSPDYQSVVFGCACNFYSLALSLGTAHEIPEEFVDLIRSTVNAAVLLSTPAFTQPRTNDTYTIPTRVYTDRAQILLGAKPEYLFVNTNRKEGAPPAGNTASAYLPYAGFAAMRSDWTEDALYLCFDVGSLGMAHCHQDMLNINLFKGRQELIYDDGGGQYEISAARTYGISAYGHNTVLVDGMAQNRTAPMCYSEPYDAGWITNDSFDYAAGEYRDTFGNDCTKPAVHKREIRFAKPDFFVVSDTLSSSDGCAHDYELLFHLDTLKVNTLPEYPNGVMSCFGKEYEIAIIPLDENADEVKINVVSAVTEPHMQGWYMGRNDQNLHPAVTVSRTITGVKNFRFHTLLIPVRSGQPIPAVTKIGEKKFSISINGKEYTFDLDSLNQ